MLVVLLAGMMIQPLAPSAYGQGSDTDALAEGAVIVARMKFQQADNQEAGWNLLRFALHVDPDNEEALLLQAKVERGLSLEQAWLEDGGAKYAVFCLNLAEKTKSEPHRLILYKVVELVDPKNAKALIELAKAKNAGVNTRFDALLAALKGDGVKAEAKPNQPLDAPPPSVQTPGSRSKDEIARFLRQTNAPYLSYSTSSLFSVVNSLNAVAHPNGFLIVPESPRFSITSIQYGTDGMPRYYGASSGDGTSPYVSMRDLSLEGALHRACAAFGLGYIIEDGRVRLVDTGSKDATMDVLSISAAQLAEAFSQNTLEALKKYRGKTLIVTGDASGVAGAMGGRTRIYLEAGKVSVTFSRETSETAQVKQFGETFKDIEKRRREARRDGYYSGYSGTLKVTVTGECTGYKPGEVTLDDCRDMLWHRN